jgi:hypothetical protein
MVWLLIVGGFFALILCGLTGELIQTLVFHNTVPIAQRGAMSDLVIGGVVWLVIGAVISAIRWRMKENQKLRAQEEKEQAERDRQKRVAETAVLERAASERRDRDYLSSQLSNTHDTVIQLKQSMPALLQSAASNLRLADQEFQRGAFSPFWAAIEEATMRLGELSESLQKFEVLVERHKQLSDKLVANHNQSASAFPVRIRDLRAADEARAVSQQMDLIVSKAQTNYQFASIYEQRRTSAILIAGFQSLGSAISGMTNRITSQLQQITGLLPE